MHRPHNERNFVLQESLKTDKKRTLFKLFKNKTYIWKLQYIFKTWTLSYIKVYIIKDKIRNFDLRTRSCFKYISKLSNTPVYRIIVAPRSPRPIINFWKIFHPPSPPILFQPPLLLISKILASHKIKSHRFFVWNSKKVLTSYWVSILNYIHATETIAL